MKRNSDYLKLGRQTLLKITAVVITAGLACAVLVVVLKTGDFRTPSFVETRAEFHSSDIEIEDRRGEAIEDIRIDRHGRRLAWLKLQDVSPALKEMVVENEDRRFYQHSGVDIRSMASAGFHSLIGGTRRGGSTLSMQLVALLSRDPNLLAGHRSILSKLKQVRMALALEKSWSKDEIFEAYLNLAHFRGELQGVHSLSRFLFHKNAHGLNRAESAVATALLRSPNATWMEVEARASRIVDPAEITRLVSALRNGEENQIDEKVFAGELNSAPHFARLFLKTPHQNSKSTLDASVQRAAIRLSQEQLSVLKDQNVHDVAVLVVENQTGDVLAYLGGLSQFSLSKDIDGVQARRQAGSTLKPFLYAASFEKGFLRPNSLISDRPFDLDTGRGLYEPQNYDHRFRGTVTVKTALASSMNIPAVRVAQMITPNVLVETLSALGFTGLNSGDDYGVSLALGTADISLWELVRAYRTLANQGLTSDLKVSADRVLNEAPPRRTFSDVTAYRIAHILSDREARAETFGLENALGTRFWSAVKTGTSKDMRDNWCVGFSSRYTVGVWVGNFDGSAMWDVSGVSGAAPIWLGLMKKLHENEPSVERERPVLLGESDEQPLVPLSKEVFGHIVSPASGTISVLDPDIPVEKRKMLFQSDSTGGSAGNSAANSRSDSKWVLDGHVIAKSDRPFLWNPRPGPHHLQLVGRSGETEDEVVFTVR